VNGITGAYNATPDELIIAGVTDMRRRRMNAGA